MAHQRARLSSGSLQGQSRKDGCSSWKWGGSITLDSRNLQKDKKSLGNLQLLLDAVGRMVLFYLFAGCYRLICQSKWWSVSLVTSYPVVTSRVLFHLGTTASVA